MQKLNESQLDNSKLAILCHKEVNDRVGNLKDKNLREYIYEVAKVEELRGLDAFVILLVGIHENRKQEVENILKTLQFSRTTHVEVLFRDGQQLAAVYEVKKK